MSTRFTPWSDKASEEASAPMPKTAYGLDWMEIQALRAKAQYALETRDPVSVMRAKIEKHFANVRRTTIRKCARSLSMGLADVRQIVARLIDAGILERDGEIWEDSVQSGQRYAAAYSVREDKRHAES